MESLYELKGFLFEGVSQSQGIIIYSPKVTPRLRYICKFVFNQGLLINFSLTDNENEFLQSKLPKINYSIKTFEHALNINPDGLLIGKEIRKPDLDHTKDQFDIFSAIFYHISRCEEWNLVNTDEHGRFVPETIFTTPLVDIWLVELKRILLAKFKTLQFPERKFKFISTIDVDNVYAYKAKPLVRQVGGMLKDIGNISLRLGTILSGKKDPFDEYDLQFELSKKYKVPLIYFFLYRNNTKYDRTIDPDHPAFIELLRKLTKNNITVGLHPSYDSSIDPLLLVREHTLLSKNSGHNVNCSRQHYLRFNIKTTPKELLKAGIQYDFTMGWSDRVGFRAATTLPFYYYDFDSESELPLLAVPFAAMDGAYYEHQKISSTAAFNKIMELTEMIRAVNGLFVMVNHDRSFSDTVAPGWRDLYEKLHEHLSS